jgi:hypothetical protein
LLIGLIQQDFAGVLKALSEQIICAGGACEKISGLWEHVIGQERTHISIVEYHRDWPSKQPR